MTHPHPLPLPSAKSHNGNQPPNRPPRNRLMKAVALAALLFTATAAKSQSLVITNRPPQDRDVEITLRQAPTAEAIADTCEVIGWPCVVFSPQGTRTEPMSFYCVGKSGRCWGLFRKALRARGWEIESSTNGSIFTLSASSFQPSAPPPVRESGE